MAKSNKSQAVYLKDYQPSPFLCSKVFLHFELFEDHAVVQTVMHIHRNSVTGNGNPSLVLNGEAMQLQKVLVDGAELALDCYQVDDEALTIVGLPQKCIVETAVIIKPQDNKTLSGLYKSRHNFCTQCESHGFRRITYFLDRPDVLSQFTVTISADKTKYPLLLSNGNLIDDKDLGDGRHWVKWEDPSLKPSYLFALVAGDLECLQDTFKTMSGRDVDLRVYVENGNLDQADYAMASLQNAMRWDETAFGREYDLDMYMIVAVSDFNMGAMENKGLNIFNDKYILAKPDTATDDDYVNIESVIGHEYFHNWSGNRVTVRDWFQITLKEGLTIFRDQSFTADRWSRDVKRIRDVNVIRNVQFSQDAGPMAHPIRPDSYIEINNFYTVTVYNKGSEVIRMQQTLLGNDTFRKAMDNYFSKFDGQAVTTEDFVATMAETGKLDMTQFKRWYSQAGTPLLEITGEYHPDAKSYTLNVKQSCEPTPGQKAKEPFHIPLSVGLLGKDGSDLPLHVVGDDRKGTTLVLDVCEAEEIFVFTNVPEEPVPSLLRHFSAPVKLHFPYTHEQLIFLMTNDADGFNRWDAQQQLAVDIMLDLIGDYQQQKKLALTGDFIDAMQRVLTDESLDTLLIAEMLTLPGTSYLINLMDIADVDAIHHVREFIKQILAEAMSADFAAIYERLTDTGDYQIDAESMGRRRLRNVCLGYLSMLEGQDAIDRCHEQWQRADNLTDMMGAIGALNRIDCAERGKVFAEFYERYQDNHLVLDKWFSLQAMSPLASALDEVKQLMQHDKFDVQNPNRARALIGAFASGNLFRFHQADGSGYVFLADQVLAIDAFNPQVAARLVDPLIRWRKFDGDRQALIKLQLERIKDTDKLSKDVYELVSKSLA